MRDLEISGIEKIKCALERIIWLWYVGWIEVMRDKLKDNYDNQNLNFDNRNKNRKWQMGVRNIEISMLDDIFSK